MTLSTSAVAVCCSRASSSSRLSRAIIFSVEREALLRRLTGLRRGIFDRVTRSWRPIGALETLKTAYRSRRASRLEGTQLNVYQCPDMFAAQSQCPLYSESGHVQCN